VHDKLVAMGFDGTDSTTRRAVAETKQHFAAGRRRVFRSWITEPGGWFQFDWCTGPTIGDFRLTQSATPDSQRGCIEGRLSARGTLGQQGRERRNRDRARSRRTVPASLRTHP